MQWEEVCYNISNNNKSLSNIVDDYFTRSLMRSASSVGYNGPMGLPLSPTNPDASGSSTTADTAAVSGSSNESTI